MGSKLSALFTAFIQMSIAFCVGMRLLLILIQELRYYLLLNGARCVTRH